MITNLSIILIGVVMGLLTLNIYQFLKSKDLMQMVRYVDTKANSYKSRLKKRKDNMYYLG